LVPQPVWALWRIKIIITRVTSNVGWISMTFCASVAHRQAVAAAWFRLSIVAQGTKPENSGSEQLQILRNSLRIILGSDLGWTDQVNYTVHKAWKALHFIMHVLKRGNSNTTSLAYMSQVRTILEYGASCLGPIQERSDQLLDRVQNKADKFGNHAKDWIWKTLAQRRKIARLCALFKAYTGERTWNSVEDRLKGPCYLSRDDHDGKIRARKPRTDIGKYCFVNRAINLEPTACRGTSDFPV
jgi:hypothetical protein